MKVFCIVLIAILASTTRGANIRGQGHQVQAGACLTSAQKEKAQKAIKDISGAATGVIVALDAAKFFIHNQTKKAHVEEAIKIVTLFKGVVVNNITSILNFPCGTCGDILNTVSDAVKVVEESLSKIEPNWTSDKLYKDIVGVLSLAEKVVGAFCPSSLTFPRPSLF